MSPAAEDTPEAKAPLLDFEAVERRFRKLETTPNQRTIDATLHHLATREPTSFHQATIYYGLERQDTPPRRKYGLLVVSIGIVFLQCFVATGLAHGVTMSTCSEQQRTIKFVYTRIIIRAQASIPIAHAARSATREFVNGAKGRSNPAVKTRQTPARWTKRKQPESKGIAMT